MAICRRCGARIRFLRTVAGKQMPVDWSRVEYIQDELYGKERVLVEGQVISCRFPKFGERATGTGFMPHFATCGKEKKKHGETN